MELLLHNVGIIQKSSITMDGLTVITGKNSSGKTTVGKVVYSLIAAGSNTEVAFEESRRSFICSQLDAVVGTLRFRRARQMRSYSKRPENEFEQILQILFVRRYARFDFEELLDFLFTTKSFLLELTAEMYIDYFMPDKSDMQRTSYNSFFDAVFDNFREWKERAIDICISTIDLINDETVFLRFLKDRTTAYLNHEFNKQIRPVRARASVANIVLSDQGKLIVSAKVRSKDSIEYTKDSTFLFPYEKCIFIDNPFVLDQLDDYERHVGNHAYRASESGTTDTLITSEDIDSRDDILVELLMQSEGMNFFSDMEIQKKYGAVFDKINKIVPGEFSKTPDGVFYIQEGSRLSVKNLATGSKMFFIIKKLLRNGLLDDTTVLVLDEPESHLHPDWINKFAEILVVLIQDIKLNVVLTTHSPNLMLALSYYSKFAGITSNAHFYLAEQEEGSNYSEIRCIDDCIGEGYSHLSLPLVEMNMQLDMLNSED